MPRQKKDAKPSAEPSATKKDGAAPAHKRGRSKSSRDPKNSATRDESSLIFSKLKLRLNGPPGPPIPIGEALRQVGLDEHAIANTYVHVVGKLTGENPDGGGVVAKVLVDVLKECSRQIEASHPPARVNPDAPVIVQLVHAVSRPIRTLPPAADVPS